MDDPVLSGVTQTCVTKLEGEVMNDTCFHSANPSHGNCVLRFRGTHLMTGISMKQL